MNLYPHPRTHFRPALLNSSLNCGQLPGMLRYLLRFLHPHFLHSLAHRFPAHMGLLVIDCQRCHRSNLQCPPI